MTTSRRLFLLAVLCLIWGSTWLVIKLGLQSLPPFLSAGLRFGLSSVILLALARAQSVPWPRSRRTHLGLLGLGLLTFGLSYGAVYWGEQHISSGLSAVLFATHPLCVMGLAHVVLDRERMTARSALGTLIGFAGVVAIFRADLLFPDRLAVTAGLVTLLSPVAASISNVAIKRWGQHLHPYQLTTLPMAYGAIALLAASALLERDTRPEFTPVAVASVLSLAGFGSVLAFAIYYTLLRQVAVSALALASYVFPVVALVLGFLVLGETLDATSMMGAATILVGIAIATTTAPRRRAAREAPRSGPA